MRRLRITIAQINTTVGDLEGNVDRCLKAVREAEALESSLIVFPELVICGYPPEDLLLKPGFLSGCTAAFNRFKKSITKLCAVIGFVDGTGPIYNAAGVIHEKENRCVYRKMFLPNYGVFDEKRYFTPGNEPVSFLLGNVAIGLSICEDLWVPEGPHEVLCHEHNVDVLLNLSASPFHAGKIHEREELIRDRALNGNTSIVYVNLVGGQDELVFDGGSMVFNSKGTCLARMSSFTESLTTLDLEFDGSALDGFLSCILVPSKTAGMKLPPQNVIAQSLSEEEEILNALVLGTRDYITKNGFTKAVIGMSGGIDSSLVAAIAVRAIGAENVIGVTMPSKYTSEGTRSDAEIVARNLGIQFMEIPIGKVFDAFVTTLASAFKGCKTDVTEENIQARIRGTLLMALSNKFGWLELTTGNKSEMATGYATLYGDMAGGFAVIKDVPKTMVFRLANLINKQEGRDFIPESIITRAPTAELRPNQKDSDTLPPYEILDPILKAYIEEDKGMEDIAALGFEPKTVKRVITFCDSSEYKRRQTPPGVKITPRAFGRDRRLPVTNRFKPRNIIPRNISSSSQGDFPDSSD